MNRHFGALAAAFALAALAGGCTVLKTWERGELQSRVMTDPPCAMEAAFDGHVHRTREAVSGASAGGGASCGCN